MLIDSLKLKLKGELFKKFFLTASTIGIFIFFVSNFFTFEFLFRSIFEKKPAMAIIFPKIPKVRYPRIIIGLPIFYWIIAIITIIFSHELFHAFTAIAQGVKVKKFGIVFLLIFPVAAFVDIGKKTLERLQGLKKVRIYCSGSLGNFFVFLIFFILYKILFFYFTSAYESKGVVFSNVLNNTPAFFANLSGVIIRIDNKTINSVYDLETFLEKKKPGEIVTIQTTKGVYKIKLAKHPKLNRSFIGISGVRNYIVNKKGEPISELKLKSFESLFKLFGWISALNIGVGMFNLLPIKPLDGGFIFEEFLKKKFKNAEKIANLTSILLAFLIVYSIINGLLPS